MNKEAEKMSFFDRYLSIWVAICIVVGIAIGKLLPIVPETLGQLEYANVSIPIAVLIWIMIFPMMLKIDFKSVVDAVKMPKGLTITLVVNWLIKPFTMFGFAWLFFMVLWISGICPSSLIMLQPSTKSLLLKILLLIALSLFPVSLNSCLT